MGDFLDKFKNLTQTWSFDRFEGEDQLKKFQTDPLITSNQWNAYDNYINNAKSKCKLVGNFGVILVVRTKTDADEELDFIYNEKINSMIDLIECEKENCFCLIENSDFDSFVTLNKSVHRVILNSENWKFSSCSCAIYMKEYVCKHIVKVAILKKLLEIDYSFVPVGIKKKRGRPQKAKPWSVRMDNEKLK